MPCGKIHNETNYTAFIWLLLIDAIVLSGNLIAGVGLTVIQLSYYLSVLAGFAYSTLLFPPDMDQDNWRPDKYWRWFKWLTYPYAWWCKHRGNSHHWFFGTLSRAIYSIFFLLFIYAFSNIITVLLFISGMYIADWIHEFLDWQSTQIRKGK